MGAQPRKRKDDPRNLQGRVALVTGASRGAGRAIAAVLGEHGATVYVTGRSVRGRPTTDNLPGTIEDSAEEVTRRGGQGIALRCDHANAQDVESLFSKIREEQARLDILVNNAWGGYEGERLMPAYFWQAPFASLGCNVRARIEGSPFSNLFCDSFDDRVRLFSGAKQGFTAPRADRQHRGMGPRQVHRKFL